MKILLIEPYYGGSHKAWADGYQHHSAHDVHLLTQPAQFWKWRMQGGAITVARMLREQQIQPDVILASDMMDISLFRSLLFRRGVDIPLALYFHENQLTYPQNRRQHHGWHFGFINFASALAADKVFFNSDFHMQSFFEELPRMLKHFGDFNELDSIECLRERCSVLPLGLSLERFDAYKTEKEENTPPVILWNHRWEDDKNPEEFFEALYKLDAKGYDFRLILAGENFQQEAHAFEAALEHFGDKVLHYGYVETFADYVQWLWQADYVVSTAYQEFFGISVAEAMYCGCTPLLANRLNYPYLVPDAYHEACLFRDGALAGLLEQHLKGNVKMDVAPLQAHVQQYDWEKMAPVYDQALESLIT